MKITDIRTLSLSRPHEPERQWRTGGVYVSKADCAIVIIDTDEGVQGIAEPCAYGTPPQIRDEVERMKPDLVGKDPTDPSINPQTVGFNAPVDTAVAGIDAALWDIRRWRGRADPCRRRRPATGRGQRVAVVERASTNAIVAPIARASTCLCFWVASAIPPQREAPSRIRMGGSPASRPIWRPENPSCS